MKIEKDEILFKINELVEKKNQFVWSERQTFYKQGL